MRRQLSPTASALTSGSHRASTTPPVSTTKARPTPRASGFRTYYGATVRCHRWNLSLQFEWRLVTRSLTTGPVNVDRYAVVGTLSAAIRSSKPVCGFNIRLSAHQFADGDSTTLM